MTTDREAAAWRREARTRLLAARSAMPPEEHRAKSAKALDGLRAWWTHLTRNAPARPTVGAYWAMRGEIDPQLFLAWLLGRGSRTALPVIAGPRQPLAFHEWKPGEALALGAFGTRQPVSEKPVAPDVLLIPLVGFDAANFRLGYGGGYYDRTLAGMRPRPLTIGLGFELGRCPTIYPQPHDIALDFIVTELA